MADKQPEWIALERARRERRRELLGGGPAVGDEAGFVTPITTGLALSGGGIRSATISLGFLQALAQKDALRDIDYVSTVSGGGYAGTFLCSLYTPQAVRQKKTDKAPTVDELKTAAAQAQAQLAATEQRAGRPDQGYVANALDWLRNSSRYLAPRGASDYLYAAAMWLRNLIAVHYVIGVSLVGVLMCLILANEWALKGLSWLCPALLQDGCLAFGLRWFAEPVASGLLYLVFAAGVGLAAVLPLGIGYWFTEASRQIGPGWLSGLATWPSRLGLGTPVAMLAAGFVMPERLIGARASTFAWCAAVVVLLAWLAYALCWSRAWFQARHTGGATMNVTRTKLTQYLAGALRVFLAALMIAAVLIASTAADQALGKAWWQSMSGMSAFAVAIAAFRPVLAKLFHLEDERKRLSVGLLALALAALGLAVVVLVWGIVARQLAGQGELAGWALVAILALSVMTGRQFQFLNLSTIQNFYTARIVRAYLGATNSARFSRARDNPWASVTEPHPRDDVSLDQYYGPVGGEFDQQLNSLAPQHIVNVTMNKTVGKTSTLVEQDRKGLPLAVTPHGYLADGEFWQRDPPSPKGKGRDAFEPLMLGRWIGISGAAFAPGLGRASRPELSLLTVLVNVRLGFWWKVTLPPPRNVPARWWWPVSTQVHLLREARGQFLGEDDSHWYLTDGGHFENTGVYELLRRRVDVVVALDNGADAEYRFDNVANLMRLASQDFGAEFEALDPLDVANSFAGTRHEEFVRLFGNPNGFGCASRKDQHFLMAYRVHLPGGPGFPAPKTVLVLFVKPRLTESASLDLVQYQALHPAFPQEPTSDQFFDDEQWESYRKLGWWQGRQMLDEKHWEGSPFRSLVTALNRLNSPAETQKTSVFSAESA